VAGTALFAPLRITAQPAMNGVVRLVVSGDVDLATAPQLRTTVLASIHSAQRPEEVELVLQDIDEVTAS
jgi:anti-anti-sigma regulatory factor